MEFGKGVDEIIEQLRTGVLPAVPDRVLAAIAQAEVGRQVDDRGCQRLQAIDLAAGLAVRQGQEEDVNRLERSARLEFQVGAASQMRVHAVNELPAQPL